MTLRLPLMRAVLISCLGAGITACGGNEPAANSTINQVEAAPVATPQNRWARVGVGACDGNELGRSAGAEPQAEMCSQPWITAVCLDGETYGDDGPPSCTYKSTPASQCSGGTARGVLYTCEPGMPQPAG